MEKDLKDASIVETNTYYDGDRYVLLDSDHDDVRIDPKDAVKDLKPWASDGQM